MTDVHIVSTDTITETDTTASTVTSTETVTSTTTISIASNAPSGTVAYPRIVPEINAGADYVKSDAAGHMTENDYDMSNRESHITTSSGQLYSVTHDSYYYYSNPDPSGHDHILWTTDVSQAFTNWSGNITSDGTELLMGDERTQGAYYKLCLVTAASGDGGSTGLHFYYLNATAEYPDSREATRLFFESV